MTASGAMAITRRRLSARGSSASIGARRFTLPNGVASASTSRRNMRERSRAWLAESPTRAQKLTLHALFRGRFLALGRAKAEAIGSNLNRFDGEPARSDFYAPSQHRSVV